MANDDNLKAGIVQVISPEMTGTGFIVSDTGLIATCSHVVQSEKSQLRGDRRPEMVSIIFLANGQDSSARVVPEWWKPANEADVALLKLEGPLPAEIHVLSLGSLDNPKRAKSFGFPRQGEGLASVDVLGKATIFNCKRRLQLSSSEITGGFSGAPLWDESSGLVIGMISEILRPDVYERQGQTAYAVPSELLCEICRELTLIKPDFPFWNEIPSRPKFFVVRSEQINPIKERLLADNYELPAITCLWGSAGTGKTILAIDLARDDEVRRRYPDGILWATLGPEPDSLGLLSNWYWEFFGAVDDKFKHLTREAISYKLKSLFKRKKILLILDDAWNWDHIKFFLIGGLNCHVVITTRDALVFQAAERRSQFDIILKRIEVMTENEALELFKNKLGEIDDSEKRSAILFAARVGYLPLALELAAVQVAGGESWDDLIDNLDRELESLDRAICPDEVGDEEIRKCLSLNASLNLSLRNLFRYLDNFIKLGILHEDAKISSELASHLWNTDRFSSKRILRYLCEKSLIYEGASNEFRILPLLHKKARNLIEIPTDADIPGLGITLNQAHLQFLQQYKDVATDGWCSLSNDGYIHAHLIWHLQNAGCIDEIHALLREQTNAGGNARWTLWESLGQPKEFIREVEEAWKRAEIKNMEQIMRGELASNLAQELGCALMIASINSLAESIPPFLFEALVETKLLMPAHALAYIERIPDLRKKAKSLLKIARFFEDNQKEMLIRKANELQPGVYSQEYMNSLEDQFDYLKRSPQMDEEYQRALEDAGKIFKAGSLTAVLKIGDEALINKFKSEIEYCIRDQGRSSSNLMLIENYSIYKNNLRLYSYRNRKDLLEFLCEHVSIILILGGIDGLIAAKGAVNNISQWWP